jgi:hypothetical protein
MGSVTTTPCGRVALPSDGPPSRAAGAILSDHPDLRGALAHTGSAPGSPTAAAALSASTRGDGRSLRVIFEKAVAEFEDVVGGPAI